tara:strand:+ start:3104 stop:4603 length:1500 start_codon:yes stop_codon:yes gene_type:complete
LSFGSDILWGDIPTFVEFDLDQFEGPRWLAWNFVNASGWLQVIEVTMATPSGWQSRTYAIGCNDEGVTLPSWEADFLLGLPTKHPMPTQHYPPDELSAIAEMSRYDFMGECDGLSLEALEGLEDETRSKLQYLELRFNEVLKLAADHLAALRSELRSFTITADRRSWIKGQIERLENEEMRAGGVFVEERQRIRQAAEARETALIESLTSEADVEVLYTVQFEARMRGREKQIAWPLIQEETFSPGWSQERAQQALNDHLEDAETRRTEEAAQRAQDAADEAEWLANAKSKKAQAAEQPPVTVKRRPNPTPKKVITFKQKPELKVAPKPAEKPAIQKPLTDAEEHTALRAEVASLSDILRHSGRSTFETKQGLWRVTRRKQPQGDELQAIYHAIGQTDGAVERFPRVLRFLALAPAPVAVVKEIEKPAESSTSAWARRAEQLERIAKTRRILSPKSKIALGKLKSGQTALSETDRNAMKHLIVQLKKTGFDVDGFLAVK